MHSSKHASGVAVEHADSHLVACRSGRYSGLAHTTPAQSIGCSGAPAAIFSRLMSVLLLHPSATRVQYVALVLKHDLLAWLPLLAHILDVILVPQSHQERLSVLDIDVGCFQTSLQTPQRFLRLVCWRVAWCGTVVRKRQNGQQSKT